MGMMKRRELLASLASLGVVAIPTTATGQTRPLNILWRNAWAIANIGDIGHVPGALALLRHYIPEATVTLGAQQDLVFRGTIAQRARFPEGSVDATTVSRKVIPDLTVVYGRLDEAGRAEDPELEAAVAAADIMVVGSGAGVNAGADLLRFHAGTKRPIGLFGATTDSFNFTLVSSVMKPGRVLSRARPDSGRGHRYPHRTAFSTRLSSSQRRWCAARS
jgi:hypothetical protein